MSFYFNQVIKIFIYYRKLFSNLKNVDILKLKICERYKNAFDSNFYNCTISFFNKIGKLYLGLALALSIYRTFISFLYTTIFPLSDLTVWMAKIIKTCNFDPDLYTNNFFYYTSPANRIFVLFQNCLYQL